MSLNFAPAVRHEAKARVAIIGPTGAGKTWTALEWAGVLGQRIAVIDTENGSAALYSDQYTFDTATWGPPYNAAKLAATIGEAGAAYDVLVVDSLTHFWQGEGGVLDVVDRAAAKARGNTYAGWKEGTPVWRSLLDALIYAPCHVIVTMRSKMEYLQQEKDGRKTIEKVGMAPVARNDVEYEFTVVGDMDQSHKMTVTKSRCAPLADEVALPNQTKRLAVVLRDWLASAAPAPERPATVTTAPVAAPVERDPNLATPQQVKAIATVLSDKSREERLQIVGDIIGHPLASGNDLTKAEASKALDHLQTGAVHE